MACGGCGGRLPAVKVDVKIEAPQILNDGTVQFPEGPAPVVEGYTMDPDDDTVLVPSGQHCDMRITGILLQRDGTYKPFHVCRHPQCDKRSEEVSFDVCDACPYRSQEE